MKEKYSHSASPPRIYADFGCYELQGDLSRYLNVDLLKNYCKFCIQFENLMLVEQNQFLIAKICQCQC